MKTLKLIVLGLLICFCSAAYSQDSPQRWTLTDCIQYALTNNLQIQKAKITLESTKISTKQAKAELLPNLSANLSEAINYLPVPGTNNYSGNYGINSSLLLFDAGKTKNNIQQQKINESIAQLSILSSEKNIQMSILQSYARILYATDAVNVYQETVKASEYQVTRGKEMLSVGSISQSDLAQLESQLSSDKYTLVSAENILASNKLDLKQLLELDLDREMNLVIPALTNGDVLKPLSSLSSIYETALKVMPNIQSQKATIQIANLDTKKAQSSFFPKISLSGSLSSGHNSLNTENIGSQMSNGLSAGAMLSVSVPIFTNSQNKSTLQKARLNEKTARLELQNVQKTLLKEIETVYQDAVSSQSQFLAAIEKVKALEISYNLIEQKYNLGMKNTVDLLTQKNQLLAAKQSLLQAKYTGIIDLQLLNLYQNLPIEIK